MQQERNSSSMNMELTVDFYSIIRAWIKDWWMILTAGLVGVIMAYWLVAVTYTPTYTSSMTFIVSSKGATSSLSDMSAASELASTFSEVLNSNLLKKRVKEELNLGYFPGTISAVVVEDTNILKLSTSAPTPEHAYRIMQSVLNNYSEITDRVLKSVVLDVMEAPEVPMAPANSVSVRDLAKKAALIAMISMAGLLALIDYLKDDIKNIKDFEQKLDAQLVGTIYYERKVKTLRGILKKSKKALLISNPTSSFLFVEAYKKIRTKLIYKMKQGEEKVILATSVTENEGKSTVAMNLAQTLAQKNYKVILIDGDLRRPACYKILEKNLKAEQELGEYLKGNISVNHLLHYDKESGLYLLIGSKHYADSTELVSGEYMRKLIEEARKLADYVIVDSPPTSLMADAELLAEYADVSLLVVRQNMTSAKMINDTIDILENGHSRFLGCVFNGVKNGVFSGKSIISTYGYNRYRYGDYQYKSGHGQEDHYVKLQLEEPVEELKLREEQA